MRAALAGGKWHTHRAHDAGKVVDTYDAKDLWTHDRRGGVGCADPGVQYDTTVNRWHTCPNTDRINASNPCSEYMFLDDSACNLASVNLTKFLRADGSFDVDGYRHACRMFFIAQEILVDLSSYPTAGHREEQPRLSPARARLREPRVAAHAARRSVRQRPRSRDRRGAHGDHVRSRVRGERGDGGDARGRSPASPRTASRCSA